MNPLSKYPRAREVLYLIQWLANGVLSVAGAYFVAAGVDIADLPRWYVITLAVAPVLWTYLGITAQSNVNPTED